MPKRVPGLIEQLDGQPNVTLSCSLNREYPEEAAHC